MSTSVPDVFNVKYCNETESSNPFLGKASVSGGVSLGEKVFICRTANTNVVILNVNGFSPSAVFFRKHILSEEVSSSF